MSRGREPSERSVASALGLCVNGSPMLSFAPHMTRRAARAGILAVMLALCNHRRRMGRTLDASRYHPDSSAHTDAASADPKRAPGPVSVGSGDRVALLFLPFVTQAGAFDTRPDSFAYTVKSGDTLWSLALDFGRDLDTMSCATTPTGVERRDVESRARRSRFPRSGRPLLHGAAGRLRCAASPHGTTGHRRGRSSPFPGTGSVAPPYQVVAEAAHPHPRRAHRRQAPRRPQGGEPAVRPVGRARPTRIGRTGTGTSSGR